MTTYPFTAVLTENSPDLSGDGPDFPAGMMVIILGEGDSEDLYLLETLDGTVQTDIEKTIVAPVRCGRRAFGAQRRLSPAQKARNVAESILAHGLDTTDQATWIRYGLQNDAQQRARVLTYIAKQKE